VRLNPLHWFTSPKDEAGDVSLSDDAVLQAFYGALSAASASGVIVTEESALRSVAVLACLIVRAETFSALPVEVIRRDGEAQVRDHDAVAYRLLAVAPNDAMTAKEFWRWKQLQEDIHGNAFVRVVWRGTEARELWPLYGPQPTMHVDRRSGRVIWQYAGDDFTQPGPYQLRDLLHFKGPVLRSPLEARSLVRLAGETIGVNIASEQFFARLLGNGSHFPGYLETDATLAKEDVDALRDQLSGFSGVLQAGVIRIFDRGLKYKQNQMTLKDAELTEQMRWQLQGICSVFRVPMAMVQDLTRGTYANSEQQDLWLAKHTMAPLCVNSEAVVRQRLFAEHPEYSVKWNLDGLLRGDYKTRTEGDATLVRAGILSRNEARGHYDLDPAPGLDRYLAELNLGVVSDDGTVTGPDQGAPADVAAVLEPVLRDAVAATRRRWESDQRKGRPIEETIAFAATKLGPIAEAYGRAGVAFFPELFATRALAGDAPTTIERGRG